MFVLVAPEFTTYCSLHPSPQAASYSNACSPLEGLIYLPQEDNQSVPAPYAHTCVCIFFSLRGLTLGFILKLWLTSGRGFCIEHSIFSFLTLDSHRGATSAGPVKKTTNLPYRRTVWAMGNTTDSLPLDPS